MKGVRGSAEAPRMRLDRLADEELIPLVVGANASAFRVVLERHGDAAFSLAYRMCGTRGVAEEVTQEAFLTAWRKAARFDATRGSLRTWILTIVHNRAIDTLRGNTRHSARLVASEDGSDYLELKAPEDTEATAIGSVRADNVRRALEQLPETQRQTIELAYYGGFTQSEIAAMLDEPLGTIKGRIRIGLHKLRDHCRGWEAVA